MTFRFFVFTTILLVCQNSFGGSYSNNEIINTLVYQKEAQIFDEDKLEELKADEDYDYTEELENSNLWITFKDWLLLQLKKIFGDDVAPGSFLFIFISLLPYIIPAIAIIIIVWYIAKTNPGHQIMRQHNKSKVILTEEEELLMELNLEQLAETAIAEQEFRLAVRYLYLNCIKRLDMKRIIRYAYDKTNYEYVKEIKFSEVSIQFRSLTLSYEQVWYGQMVFDEAYFRKFKDKYENFQGLLDQKQYAKA
jgi:hypothetical protein